MAPTERFKHRINSSALSRQVRCINIVNISNLTSSSSDIPHQAWAAAVDIISDFDNLFENDSHFGDISDLLGNIGGEVANNLFGTKWTKVGNNVGRGLGKVAAMLFKKFGIGF